VNSSIIKENIQEVAIGKAFSAFLYKFFATAGFKAKSDN
jgi:hypothetical protein